MSGPEVTWIPSKLNIMSDPDVTWIPSKLNVMSGPEGVQFRGVSL